MGNEVGWENIGNVCWLGSVDTRGCSQITAFKEEIICFSFFQVKLLRPQTNTFQLSGYSGASAYYLSFQINLAFPHTWVTLYRAVLCFCFCFDWFAAELQKRRNFTWPSIGRGLRNDGLFVFFVCVKFLKAIKCTFDEPNRLRGNPICSCNNCVLVAAAISVHCQAEDIYCSWVQIPKGVICKMSLIPGENSDALGFTGC